MKRLIPVILNTIIFSIIGAIIGKNIVEIHNTKKRISADSKALKQFIEEVAGSATNITIEDIDKADVPEDIRKKADDSNDPVDPTVIYVYD